MTRDFSRISEAEIDDVLGQALTRSPEFASRFLSTFLPEGHKLRVDGICRQVPHFESNGTIDLDITLSDGRRLLVENKIDAGWSVTRRGEAQPERYRRSVAALTELGVPALCVLVSPRIYLEGSRKAEMFDARVSYETLALLLSGADATKLRRAILQAETPYEPVPNSVTGDFFTDYAIVVREEFPYLILKTNPNGGDIRPIASRTIYFDAGRMVINHQNVPRPRISVQAWDSSAAFASAKFMIAGWGLLAGRQPAPESLERIGAYLRPAGRSLGLVIDTPRLETQQPFQEQVEAARNGLNAINLLRLWWNEHGAEMAEWYQKAREV